MLMWSIFSIFLNFNFLSELYTIPKANIYWIIKKPHRRFSSVGRQFLYFILHHKHICEIGYFCAIWWNYWVGFLQNLLYCSRWFNQRAFWFIQSHIIDKCNNCFLAFKQSKKKKHGSMRVFLACFYNYNYIKARIHVKKSAKSPLFHARLPTVPCESGRTATGWYDMCVRVGCIGMCTNAGHNGNFDR